ncbi:family 43 glycosylhydrolase [Streptomyces caniscabiei]|uniref:Family 43 glycosylhydrolase n=1 Tax=Streptomyces caniscabiei TaxID=2746961 RepID=A0A927L7E0_9ACTN|nr:family 43 glycosylhydrolase [Streptomyces caniscabiei]MBD9726982.1 family 43 glycosylhydrolase [Streptomyces caniscabiei]MDX3513615.1 family 43 glycosylhydrolase [Streptomyces caniscabiei]MDX3722694.1 family 43 glycosylhydrolase [Streptomyces caniscabiei]WEO29877.1 family 43 glycosylhydrolase [Streptomyces caniscabiei]
MTVARNPVIRGFAPDPSLIRVGEWYYVATSSFEWFPTIPLHRSRDLAHWEYAGHVRGAAPGGSLRGVPDSAGIWAPSLSWDGERFWVIYTIVRSVGTRYFDLDTYVSTAATVDGEWTAPRRVASHGFDPALFHHEGRLWLLNMQSDHRPGGERFAGIVLTELDRATLRPVGDTHLLLQHDRLIEGPKLLIRDGWFYLVLAEGGTGVEHGVRVARSRALTGPYELDDVPLLTTRDDPKVPLQKAGHAELVRTPTGEWFLSHLTARPLHTDRGIRCTLGRETAIQAVTWDPEGWPRLRQGGWHPEVEVEVPGVGVPAAPSAASAPASAPEAVRDSSEGMPVWPWSTLRAAPDASWVDTGARPGWIRLRGRQGPESLWDQSVLAQRLTEHRAEVEVTVEARPRTFGEAAGLTLRYNTASYLSLDLTWAEPEGERQRGQQWRGEGRTVLSLLERDEDGARQVAVVEVEPGRPITLGASIDGAEARFWYLRDGLRTPVGPPLDFTHLSDDYGSRLRFTGTLVGIHAQDLVAAEFTADFSGFRLVCGAE